MSQMPASLRRQRGQQCLATSEKRRGAKNKEVAAAPAHEHRPKQATAQIHPSPPHISGYAAHCWRRSRAPYLCPVLVLTFALAP